MIKISFICLMTALASCITWNKPGSVAENVGFIAFDTDLSDLAHLGTIEGQSCYWILKEPSESHGPEHKAFAAFLKSLKEKQVRYVANIRSEHYNETVALPFVGGTSMCVKFYGEAYR